MSEFRVRIEIDVESQTPLLAAIEGWQLLTNPSAQQPVVEVREFIGEQNDLQRMVQIDLDEWLGVKPHQVRLPRGLAVELSAGVHNELQRLIVEEFAPRVSGSYDPFQRR